MTPDTVIFDLDGTLIDSLPDLVTSVNETLKRYGKPEQDAGVVKSHVGDGPDKLIERTFASYPDVNIVAATAKYLDIYAEHSAEKSTLMPGVDTVLNHLSGRRLAVVTNKLERFARENLDKLNILDAFDIVIGWDSGFETKPSAQALLHVCDQFGVAPENAAMVGDGVPDVRAGRAAGINTYALLNGFTQKERLLAESPAHTLHRIDELITLWEN